MRVVYIYSILLLFIFSSVASSVLISPPTEFRIGNITYTVNQPMNFYIITIDSSYILFDEIKFVVMSENGAMIRLVYLDKDVFHAVNDEKILDFYMYPESQFVWFYLCGFRVGTEYQITRDGTVFSTIIANGGGCLSFLNNQWGTHRFIIYQKNNPPDWDIDSNGLFTMIDCVLISNHLGETGPVGWIREDVDKNGIVQIADLLSLASHYGESWT